MLTLVVIRYQELCANLEYFGRPSKLRHGCPYLSTLTGTIITMILPKGLFQGVPL